MERAGEDGAAVAELESHIVRVIDPAILTQALDRDLLEQAQPRCS